MNDREPLEALARRAVRRYDRELLRRPEVHAVGVGRKRVGGLDTGEIAIVIVVETKRPLGDLAAEEVLPTSLEVDGIELPTDVVQGGPFRAMLNNTRLRPAQPGASTASIEVRGGFGTLGAMVWDLQGNPYLLSNNHVLANVNRAPIGTIVVQPSPGDGGTSSADGIATLYNFITLSFTSDNLVDAAIAAPIFPSGLSPTPLDGVPAPNAANPAVGLCFAGGFLDGVPYAVYNPITTVLVALGVVFQDSASVTAPALGMAIQQVGRTTDRTTGLIQVLGATTRTNYPGQGVAVFVDQFVSDCPIQPGDSGSVAVLAS